MSKALPAPGNHPARKDGNMVVYEAESGALCVALPVMLLSTEVAWKGKHTITIGKKDGTLQTRRIEDLKRIFGWDGINPFDLENIDPDNTAEFEVVGEHETYTPPEGEAREVFKIIFLNPPGGSQNMPEVLDEQGRKQLITKWGSKFKAVSGGKAAAKPAAQAAKPAAAKPGAKAAAPSRPAAGGPPSRGKSNATSVTPRTSTQEEVWQALVAANEGVSEDELATKYYEAQDAVAPDANGELTPTQWGEVADNLGV